MRQLASGDTVQSRGVVRLSVPFLSTAVTPQTQAASSGASDIDFTVRTRGGQTTFRLGEIILLENLLGDAKGNGTSSGPARQKARMHPVRGGLFRSRPSTLALFVLKGRICPLELRG